LKNNRAIFFLKWIYGGSGELTLVSIFIGFILSWMIKNNLTQLMFSGKAFNGRSILYKIFLIVFCTCFLATLFLVLVKSIGRIKWVDIKLKQLGDKLPQSIKQLGKYRILIILFLFLVCIAAILLLSSLNPQTNDDAFVYYNYALNLTQGRPFAYDVRNIPTEGFSSLLYLLLLTPFQFFKINMTFASMLINLVAIAAVIITVAKLVRASDLLTRESTLAFLAVLIVFLVVDGNIKQILDWGLETMLGPLMVLLAGLAIFYSDTPLHNHRGINAFFVILFLAYITRPESIVFIAVCGLPLMLINKNSRKEVIKKLIIFSVFFVAYHVLIYFFFGDIMPTGFYRKVSSGSGYGYVWDWIVAYKPWLYMLGAVIILNLVYAAIRRHWVLFHYRWLWFLSSVSIITLLFFTQTRPLVGLGFRFLINPIIILYILLGLLIFWFFDQILIIGAYKKVIYFGLLLILFVFCWINSPSLNLSTNTINAINIYSKSKQATENHKYLKLGYFLHDSIPQADDITLVFGDAGAIPYSFGGRFIDANGLTEPALAHLFQQPDGPQKTQAYINHILAQHPDIVVLAWGNTQADGSWLSPVNEHSPFQKAIPIDLYKAYKDYGLVYSCSIHLYYDIHIGLWIHSPYYSELQTVFHNYCDKNGYVLSNGLTITDGSTKVTFPIDLNLKLTPLK
jgi:hypothetical protein